MKKMISKFMSRLCYILGMLANVYVGIWMMAIKPIRAIVRAISTGTVVPSELICNIILVALSATIGGMMFCIGYIGYNHFKGTEDPEWGDLKTDVAESQDGR